MQAPASGHGRSDSKAVKRGGGCDRDKSDKRMEKEGAEGGRYDYGKSVKKEKKKKRERERERQCKRR